MRSYHAALRRLKIAPYRRLEDDLQATPRGSAYGGARAAVALFDSEPDFSKMTTAEKIAWNRARWKRILG